MLDFKSYLENLIGTQNIEENFKNALNSSAARRKFEQILKDKTINAHDRSHLQAIIISLFLEKEGYSLSSWNRCRNILKNLERNSFYNIYINAFNQGRVFELFIMHTINRVFKPKDIIAVEPSGENPPKRLLNELRRDFPKSWNVDQRAVINQLKIPLKAKGMISDKVWGDNDIIILGKENDKISPIAVISCKVSLRERIFQSAFWAQLSRNYNYIENYLVTLDKGSSGRTEIGNRTTSKNVKKNRKVLEASMDRVYVLRKKEEVERSATIKAFEKLNEDLLMAKERHFGN